MSPCGPRSEGALSTLEGRVAARGLASHRGREHLAELVHRVCAQALRGVVLVQAAEALVRNTPHPHMITVTLQNTVCQEEDIPNLATGGWQWSTRRAHTDFMSSFSAEKLDIWIAGAPGWQTRKERGISALT